MDVDGEEDDERSPPKRRKSNTGTAVTATGKHAPRTNRQMAGMRDQSQVSKAVRLRNLGQRERNMHAKAGESDRAIRVKMVSRHDRGGRVESRFCSPRTIFSPSICFLGNERRERHRDDKGFVSSLLYSVPLSYCWLALPLSAFWSLCTSSHSAHSSWFISQNSPMPYVIGTTRPGRVGIGVRYMSHHHTPGIYERL